jgi:biotin carboxyl carrier protein
MLYDVSIDGKNYRLELNRAEGRWSCRLDGREVEVDAILARRDVLSLRIGNRAYEIKSEHVRDPRSLRSRTRAGDDHGPRKVVAPMPGKVVRLLVKEGDEVAQGAGIAVMEAMKMQNEIKSPKKGTIQKILVGEGSAVNPGDVLAIVE